MSSPNAAASPVRNPSRLIATAMLAMPPGAEPSPSVTSSVPGGGSPGSPVKIMSMKTWPVRNTSSSRAAVSGRPCRCSRSPAGPRSLHGSSMDGSGGRPMPGGAGLSRSPVVT
jgi:hypothetical protein